MAKLNKVHCPTCQADIGTIHIIDRKAHLDDGFMLVRIGFRRCHICGKVYHWHGEQFDKQYAAPLEVLLAVAG